MSLLSAATLNEQGLPWHVTVLEEVGSTSDWLKERAHSAPVGTVVFAESQTAGRGRRDNRWVAPPGKDLMFSLLLQPDAPLEKWARVTTLAALALCKAIEAELPLQPQIKWPNDLYLRGLKVSGLLAETVAARQSVRLVLGIGLNVNATAFPPGLAATSLLHELHGQPPGGLDRTRLAAVVLEALASELTRLEDDFSAAMAEVRARSWLLGRQIRARTPEGEVFGRVLDLSEEGHLILEAASGSTHLLTSAEEVREVRL